MKLFFKSVILAYVGCFCACNPDSASKKPANSVEKVKIEPPKVEKDSAKVLELSKNILSFLANKDYKSLSMAIHPTQGVRFSPYAFVDTAKHQRVMRDWLVNAKDDSKKWIWGVHDATGDKIELTFLDYMSKWVWNKDYSKAPKIGFNQSFAQGNSQNNANIIYPNSVFTEFYFSGIDPKYNGMDWTALRLVFKKEGDQYFLVGIIHDQWTS